MRFAAHYQIGLAKYRLINLIVGLYCFSMLPVLVLGTWLQAAVALASVVALDRVLWRVLFRQRRR